MIILFYTFLCILYYGHKSMKQDKFNNFFIIYFFKNYRYIIVIFSLQKQISLYGDNSKYTVVAIKMPQLSVYIPLFGSIPHCYFYSWPLDTFPVCGQAFVNPSTPKGQNFLLATSYPACSVLRIPIPDVCPLVDHKSGS